MVRDVELAGSACRTARQHDLARKHRSPAPDAEQETGGCQRKGLLRGGRQRLGGGLRHDEDRG